MTEVVEGPDKAKSEFDRTVEQARKDFSQHVLKINDAVGGRWLIAREDSSVFWVEVVALAGGRLLVHGDIDHVLFARYSPAARVMEVGARNLELVYWMGSRKSPDDSYFLEKARIGSEVDEIVYETSERAFREQMGDLIAETEDPETREGLQEILERVDCNDDVDGARREVYDLLGDSEQVPDGKEIRASIIYVHAALQRLVALLGEDERKGRDATVSLRS